MVQLVGQAIAGRREEVTLATKFGNERGEDGSFIRVNGTPEYVQLRDQAMNFLIQRTQFEVKADELDIDVSDEADVMVTMTLTTPHCPVAESMPGEVELRVGAVPGVRDAEVSLVWDPPWGPDKMTDEARLELGML